MKRLMKQGMGFLLLLGIVFTSLTIVRAVVESQPSAPVKSFAERINSACKPGYTVADWATSDYFGYIQEGVVLVTCQNIKTGDVYQLAVDR